MKRSGPYTTKCNRELPFGLKHTQRDKENLRASFNKHLVLFIGEQDDKDETGGILLRSPTVDQQGIHRLARGKYFYQESREYADRLKAEFNWDLKIIPDVGHDYERMSKAAAKYLYEINP